MKSVLFAGIVLVLMEVAPARGEGGSSADSMVAWYQQHYPFISMEDSIYTFETEFVFPDGFHRPDSSRLTAYQNWVANFPLWHRYKPVGEWTGRKAFESNEISRAVHIPWRGREYTDLGFMLRLAAEWLRRENREYGLVVVPRFGDTLTYEKWLSSKPVRTATGALELVPATPRDSSAMEYYRYLATCMRNVDYSFFEENGDTVAPADVRPGDMLVGHSEDNREGKAYVILNMLVNDTGEKLYVVATGCNEACDFHIPLVTDDRSSPWLTEPEMAALVADYAAGGYYRLDIVQ